MGRRSRDSLRPGRGGFYGGGVFAAGRGDLGRGNLGTAGLRFADFCDDLGLFLRFLYSLTN